ncbi:hypothetical protein KM910_20825 [Virgibacillus pantothenticus]|uniref:hypothetical protein n=1 Tax=Virgibacillus pantothenticus TaxID=1473 RepID=UPI001C23C27F|nr:hypothetical protein [Virgibacillus pantothenticus]MBU8601330.1 hypothetical protein [Virgibacillus pantothenticus]MBU8636970.1 hypothetical protein [Virgibacillus pantothenticus]MBU8666724.1 hypothetical protein [Virgibacillus pantothenticus]MEB5454064.1 hypothetical protein [Virgibacillus pantothenticus]MEB5462500.1 hypothetical protein [Virgibacillus pantothenticus]
MKKLRTKVGKSRAEVKKPITGVGESRIEVKKLRTKARKCSVQIGNRTKDEATSMEAINNITT